MNSPDLSCYTEEERAKIWCALNAYRWPSELVGDKPDGWDALPESERMQLPHVKKLWETLCFITPIKTCLREWNRDRMTDVEFERWWKYGMESLQTSFRAATR